MGGFSPIINGVTKAISLGNSINTAAGLFKQFSGMDAKADRAAQINAERTLQAQHKLEEKQAAERASSEKLKIQTEADAATRSRQDALRRAVARRRAEFGASGVSSADGSGEAVLLGLIDEGGKDQATNNSLTQLRMTALDDSLAQQRARNLLELSAVQSRNSLRSLSRFG